MPRNRSSAILRARAGAAPDRQRLLQRHQRQRELPPRHRPHLRHRRPCSEAHRVSENGEFCVNVVNFVLKMMNLSWFPADGSTTKLSPLVSSQNPKEKEQKKPLSQDNASPSQADEVRFK